MKLSTSFLTVALIAVFLTVCMAYSYHDCSVYCDDEDRPVCGERQTERGLQKTTFGNFCKMRQQNECGKGQKYKRIGKGPCNPDIKP
uniref:Putative kazal-type inhibitor n=1 Tax=Panstrongylus lignarius TaxID=156445 RepID=A0A224XS50_9HEMI